MIPAAATKALLLMLAVEACEFGPQIQTSYYASQIEVESAWNVKATLRTSREFGAGLGQFTTAYNADGSTRFDSAAEMRAKYKQELDGFRGDGLYDPRLAIRALVLKNRDNYALIQDAANHRERVAFTMASYNAGAGLVRKDRLLCANTSGCNPAQWYGNTEKQGYQSKTRWQGYGQSAFDITRSYVRKIEAKRPEYAAVYGA